MINSYQLTLLDGSPITVNLDRVAYIQPSGDHTRIVFNEAISIIVSEDYQTVACEAWAVGGFIDPDGEGPTEIGPRS
jgi:hypothetical protein